MKILVTGGVGYIGSILVGELIRWPALVGAPLCATQEQEAWDTNLVEQLCGNTWPWRR